MSAYSIGTSSDGTRTWWANWQMGGGATSGYVNVRHATREEAALMDKVLWEQDTDADRAKLRKLIARTLPAQSSDDRK